MEEPHTHTPDSFPTIWKYRMVLWPPFVPRSATPRKPGCESPVLGPEECGCGRQNRLFPPEFMVFNSMEGLTLKERWRPYRHEVWKADSSGAQRFKRYLLDAHVVSHFTSLLIVNQTKYLYVFPDPTLWSNSCCAFLRTRCRHAQIMRHWALYLFAAALHVITVLLCLIAVVCVSVRRPAVSLAVTLWFFVVFFFSSLFWVTVHNPFSKGKIIFLFLFLPSVWAACLCFLC